MPRQESNVRLVGVVEGMGTNGVVEAREPAVEAGFDGEGRALNDGAPPAAHPVLSEETIALLEDAAPKIKSKVPEITGVMYRSLFEAHPALKSSFSIEFHAPASQSQDDPARALKGGQPVILAQAIVAVLGNLRSLDKLDSTIQSIADKHVSRNVLPAHYDVLESFFLGAIQVIAEKYDVYTPELMNAFKEAYKFLAYVFTSREADIRKSCLVNGGWIGFRKFEVAAVEPAENAVMYRLRPSDGKSVAPFYEGAYISIVVNVPEHGAVTRSFKQSLSAQSPEDYLIEVQSEQMHGTFSISNKLLVSTIKEGTTIEVSCPVGGTLEAQSGGSCPVSGSSLGSSSGCPMMN